MFIVDGNAQQAECLAQLLGSQGYETRWFRSWSEIPAAAGPLVVLVNLDTVHTTNRQLMEAGGGKLGVVLLTISSQPYHPELSQAMQECVFASLCEPLDTQELLFWLRSAGEVGGGPGGQAP